MFKPKYVKKVLFTNKQILDQIKLAGKWATKRFSKINEPVVAICILKGAVNFFSCLSQNIEHELQYDFTTLKSYRGVVQGGKPKIVTNLSMSIKNRHVLIIEDVADTAKTLHVLLDNVKKQKPKSITTMIMVDKIDCRVKPFKPSYSCFSLKGNPFIIGFGLDCNEYGRNLPYIAEFDKKYLNKLK